MPSGTPRPFRLSRYSIPASELGGFSPSGIASDARIQTSAALLAGAETAGTLTPIAGDALRREAPMIHLRLQSPLRGKPWQPIMRQDDASDLALFRAACEPGLGL